jgi:hypothetical protein
LSEFLLSLFDSTAKAASKVAQDTVDAALSPLESYQQHRAEEADREEKLKKKLKRSEAATRKANTRMWIGLSVLTIGVLSSRFIQKKG